MLFVLEKEKQEPGKSNKSLSTWDKNYRRGIVKFKYKYKSKKQYET
jgi:hypothetical protein